MIPMDLPTHHYAFLHNALHSTNPRSIHALTIKTGLLLLSTRVSNTLISRYSKLGSFSHAHKLFDEMPESQRDVVSYNSILTMLAKAGRMACAQELFSKMPQRDSVSWVTMVAGLNRQSRFKEAVFVFSDMVRAGFVPTQFGFTGVLSSCAYLEAVCVGRNVHSFAVKLGFGDCLPVVNSLLNFYGKCGDVETAEIMFGRLVRKDVYIWNTMITLYARAGQLDYAERLFDEMPKKNIVSWNSVIAGYNQNGSYQKALDLFSVMLNQSDMQPDGFTLSTVLSSCANLAMLRQGKQIHAFIVRREALYNNNNNNNNQVNNALVAMYAKSGEVDLARKVVDKCTTSDVNLISLTALLEGYVKLGNLASARNTFDIMKQRDVVAWTAMIVGYEQNGLNYEAMDLFRSMLKEGVRVKPNSYTLAAILSVCANLAALNQGKQIHCRAIRSGDIDSISVSNAVLTMYARCGNVPLAKRVFDKIPLIRKQTFTWNSMVVALAQQGMGEFALGVFYDMIKLKVKPDHITYVGVLSACAHNCSVQKGKMIFEQMQYEHKIVPTMSHYTCMIDLLSRAGKFQEAEDFIAKMPVEPDSVAWGSILAACRVHKNTDMAKKAAEKLLAIDPWNSGAYSTLANIYSTCGEWNKAAEVWKRMREGGIKKEQGVSLFA